MKLEWMGRYRELVRALVFYSNSSNHYIGATRKPLFPFTLNQCEYQVLEYICEFEDENKIMSDIARETGFMRSSVSKATQRLLSLNLIERFHFSGNKKSIVLKPTEAGKAAYIERYKAIEHVFQDFFQQMDDFTDDELHKFEKAVHTLGGDWGSYSDSTLEKID